MHPVCILLGVLGPIRYGCIKHLHHHHHHHFHHLVAPCHYVGHYLCMLQLIRGR